MNRSSRILRAATVALCGAALVLAQSCGRNEGEVGAFSNDLLGNEIRIDALADPRIENVVCHMAYFERGVLDRARQGNWFEDPSNTSISCQRTGPLDLTNVPTSRAGEEIFNQRQSLFFKKTALRRILDLDHRSLLYVSHSREVIEGSAKMSISSILLTEDEVTAARAAER